MVIADLTILGLVVGSFINVLVNRMHAGKDFVRGRSHCDHCEHTLKPLDLVPVFSWLVLRGRCRYCHKSISWEHPVVELITAAVFVFSYVWWPVSLSSSGQQLLLAGWLLTSVGLIALAIYDLKWMLLPNKILYPTFLVSVIFRLNHILAYSSDKKSAFIAWAAAVAVASGLFLAIYMLGRGKWIGFGDVRLGLVTGTWLADPTKAFIMIFIASLAGSIVAVGLIMGGRKGLKSKIPYGPFLIIATFVTALFGQGIIDWYNRLFIG